MEYVDGDGRQPDAARGRVVADAGDAGREGNFRHPAALPERGIPNGGDWGSSDFHRNLNLANFIAGVVGDGDRTSDDLIGEQAELLCRHGCDRPEEDDRAHPG